MRILYLALMTLLFIETANAQSVSESWLRQAAISCGGGQTEEVRAEVETKLISQFQATSEKRADNVVVGDVALLLEQFDEKSKDEAYISYSECLKGLVKLVVETSGLPANEVQLDADVALAGLSVAKRGDRVVMIPGDTIALVDWATIFTVNYIYLRNEKRQIDYTWSNSNTGNGATNYVYQGEVMYIGENCILTAYNIDLEKSAASIIVNCQ